MKRYKWRLVPEVFAAVLVWLLVPLLPRRGVLGLARFLGYCGWTFSRRDRAVARANLDLAYGEQLTAREKDAIGRSCFQSFALTMLDLFWFCRFTKSRYGRYVRVNEKMRAVMGQSPVIGVTGHLGNWEILNMLYSMEGRAMTAVAMPLKNPFVNRLLRRLRMRSGSEPLPREGAVRGLLRALRSGEAIGLVLDQNTLPAEGGVWVSYFGLPVPVSNAAGMLAIKTGSPLFVVAAFADRKGVYHFDCSELVSGEGMTAEAITAEMTRRLEDMVRVHPETWLWSYKRWRYYREADDAGRFPFYARRES